MSELIQQFPGKKLIEWAEWYESTHPEAISAATERVMEMLRRMKNAMNEIDRNMVETWIRDLVVVKTFVGLRFQEAVLKRVAQEKETTYQLATPKEEAKGVDGFIGDKPVSIKPASYKTKPSLLETIEATIIFYTKTKTGLVIEWDDEVL